MERFGDTDHGVNHRFSPFEREGSRIDDDAFLAVITSDSREETSGTRFERIEPETDGDSGFQAGRSSDTSSDSVRLYLRETGRTPRSRKLAGLSALLESAYGRLKREYCECYVIRLGQATFESSSKVHWPNRRE